MKSSGQRHLAVKVDLLIIICSEANLQPFLSGGSEYVFCPDFVEARLSINSGYCTTIEDLNPFNTFRHIV